MIFGDADMEAPEAQPRIHTGFTISSEPDPGTQLGKGEPLQELTPSEIFDMRKFEIESIIHEDGSEVGYVYAQIVACTHERDDVIRAALDIGYAVAGYRIGDVFNRGYDLECRLAHLSQDYEPWLFSPCRFDDAACEIRDRVLSGSQGCSMPLWQEEPSDSSFAKYQLSARIQLGCWFMSTSPTSTTFFPSMGMPAQTQTKAPTRCDDMSSNSEASELHLQAGKSLGRQIHGRIAA